MQTDCTERTHRYVTVVDGCNRLKSQYENLWLLRRDGGGNYFFPKTLNIED